MNSGENGGLYHDIGEGALALSKSVKIRESFGDRLFLSLNYGFLTFCLLIVIYPLIYIVSASFSPGSAVVAGRVWLFPVNFTLQGYKLIFETEQIMVGYMNSIIYTVVGTLINVTLTVMLAYPLSRRFFYGRNFIMAAILFTMLFSGGLIPLFLVVKELQMLDTRWALWIPGAVAVWQVIISRTFFQQSIPEELSEAAEMDGCSDIRFITSIVLPLSKPILAVIALMYAVGHWNSYFDALIYLSDPGKFPLQLILRSLLIVDQNSMIGNIRQDLVMQGLRDTIKFSLIVVASLPVLIIYPFIQKYFVQGMLIGSVKG